MFYVDYLYELAETAKAAASSAGRADVRRKRASLAAALGHRPGLPPALLVLLAQLAAALFVGFRLAGGRGIDARPKRPSPGG